MPDAALRQLMEDALEYVRKMVHQWPPASLWMVMLLPARGVWPTQTSCQGGRPGEQGAEEALTPRPGMPRGQAAGAKSARRQPC
jgi:hypothetical protein